MAVPRTSNPGAMHACTTFRAPSSLSNTVSVMSFRRKPIILLTPCRSMSK